MALIIPSDSYNLNASEKTITLSSPYDSIGAEQILSIRNTSKNQLIYDCEMTTRGNITVTAGVITFTYGGNMDDTDIIQVKIEFGNQNFAGIELASIDGGTP